MARPCGGSTRVKLVVGAVRRDRAGLLRTTALQAAAVLAFAAPGGRVMAQPAATARPQGGQVVGGQASISQTTAQTNVVQGSQRAAIDWRSFDVGSGHTVTYQQPNSSAVVLNRVTSPDPSQIAGRISANGQVIITNQSGVVFHQGSQVNAAGLVVSAAGIKPENFMAGRMVFDQRPNPDAQVTNAGSITVKEAGLAALVAPRVANSGTITARMGRAVLAGAETHTVDLYGDGLLSIDVTGKVRQAPRGADGKPVTALVTNTGTVVADGGTVTLTAAAADGIVQDLVQAGGRIRANTVGNRQGRIEVAGTGGSVVVEGRLGADGREPGSVGGAVQLSASGAVTVTANARVTASGDSGGGTVAVGTTLARARSGPQVAGEAATARVTVARGARIAANARRQGQGGNVTLLASDTTDFQGSVEARGGKQGGDGGSTEVSGGTVKLDGRVDTSAPRGRVGTILLDPYDLQITTDAGQQTITPGPTSPQIGTNDGSASGTSFVRASTIRGLSGNVELQASHDLTLDPGANLAMPNAGQSITLTAGNRVTISLGSTISGGPFAGGCCGTPGGSVTLNAGAGGISLLGTVSTAVSTTNTSLNGGVTLNATGGEIVQGAGSITTYRLGGGGASAQLDSTANQVSNVGAPESSFTTTSGGFSLTNAPLVPLFSYVEVPNGQTIRLTTDALGVGQLQAAGGTVVVQPSSAGRLLELTTNSVGAANTLSLRQADIDNIQAGTLRFGSASAGNLSITGTPSNTTVDFGLGSFVRAQRLDLLTAGSVAVGSNAALAVQTLSGQAASVTLAQPATVNGQPRSRVVEVAGFITTGDFKLDTGGANVPSLTVSDALTGANVNLSTIGRDIVLGANVTATAAGGYVRLDADDGASLATSGTVRQTGGVVSADLFSGRARLVNLTTTAGSRIGQIGFDRLDPSLGNVQLGAVGTFSDYRVSSTSGITIGGPLSSSGNGVVELSAGGAITQTAAGTLTAPSFTGQATSATLTNPGNTVGSLLLFQTTAGSFSLTSQGDLRPVDRVVSTADITLTSARDLILSGDIQARTGTVTLNSGGATTQRPGAIIEASTLTGQAGTLSPTVSLESANRIGTLGNYTVTADPSGTPASFTLFNAQPLQVTGTVQTLRNGTSAATGTVRVGSSGDVTQAAGSTIRTGTLLGSAASAAFTSTLNQVGTLGGFTTTAGDLSLFTTLAPTSNANPTPAPLGVEGANLVPTGRQITLRADQMSIGSASTLSAQGGTVTLAPLTGGRRVELIGDGAAQDANSLTLRQGGLNRITTGTLQVGVAGTGPINLGNAGDAISLASRAAVLRLTSAAAVTQGNGGTATLTVPTIAGTAASASLPGANGIGTLADFNVTNAFALNSAQALAISGPVQAGTQAAISSAAGLTVSGNVTAPDLSFTTTAGGLAQTGGTITGTTTVRLGIAGDVTQANGALLVTDLLQGTAGSLSLTTRGNQVANLGPFDAGTSLVLLDGRSLTVAGPVDPPVLTLDVIGDLAINSTLTGGTVTLNATGAITEGPGGVVNATTLQGAAASATFGQLNQVGTLAGFTTTGGFTLVDGAGGLAVTGPVTDGTQVGIRTTGPLSLQGDVTAPTVALTALTGGLSAVTPGNIAQTAGTVSGSTQVRLQADGTIAQTGGAIAAGVLTGSSGGTTSLPSAGNQVATLGDFTSRGGFTLNSGRALRLTGTVADDASVQLAASGNLSLAGTITGLSGPPYSAAALPAVTLTATGGAITQPGGSILTRLLTGRGDAGASLTSATNQVFTLGQFSGGTGNFALASLASATSPLGIAGAVSARPGGTLTLNAEAISIQPGGSLTASGGTVALAPLSNSPFQLSSFVPAGTAAAVTADTLQVGRTDGGSVGITGTFILTGVGTLDLRSGSAITEAPGASLQVRRLTGSAASAALDGPNLVGTLGEFSTVGAFSLANAQALDVAGSVTGGAGVQLLSAGPMRITAQGGVTGPDVSLRTTAGGLAIDGPVTGRTTVRLQVAGDVTQSAISGFLTTPLLQGSAGSVSLPSLNQVGALGNFASAGDFLLRTAPDPDVVGAASVGTGRTLSLISNGIRFQPGGLLSAPDGRVALVQLGFPGYRLTSLAPAGGGSLVTANTLDVGLSSSIAVTGTFDLSGVGQLALRSTGAVTQAPGSSIQVARLTGNAASLVLDGANRIGALGGFSTATGFTLNNAQGLTVAGTVQDGAAVRLSAAGALAVNGAVGAPDVRLASTGLMTLGAGAAITGTGGPVALISGDAILLAGTIATPGQLSLDANGHVEQFGGRIAVGSLTGTAVELASLPSGTNAVGTLGRFALTGSTFVLVNGQPLVVQGPVASGVIRIDAAGGIVLAGGQLVTRDALLRVLAGSGTGSLVQRGTTVIGSADGSTATVRLALVGGGTATFDDLRAAGANLVLDLGSGRATGNAVLGNLLVRGSGGSADLSGQVAGRTGVAAARVSTIEPAIDLAYLFNNCAIATACGVITQPEPVLLTVPVVSELFPKSFQDTLLGSLLRTNLFTVDLFTLGILRDPADPNLVLPNISDRDY